MRMLTGMALWLCLALSLVVTGLTSPAVCAGEKLTVLAAASLTESMEAMKAAFEKSHPGVEIRLSFASSSSCRMQIAQGAPADVFLSADTENMDPLAKAGVVEKPTIFARNTLTIIVARENPAGVSTPADLAKPGVKIVTCAPQVPIGNYTRQVIDKMDASGNYGANFKKRVLANIVSEEPNVKGTVAKVTLGEANAAFCYVSDVTPTVKPRVKTIPIPEKLNVIGDYPLAVVSATANRALAEAFVKMVLSPDGQKILKAHGLLPAQPKTRQNKPAAPTGKG